MKQGDAGALKARVSGALVTPGKKPEHICLHGEEIWGESETQTDDK